MQQIGNLKRIGTTKQVTEKFKNRTFDIETIDDKYPQTLRFELSQDSCDIIDAYAVGQEIDVTFGLRGREWQKTPEDDVVVFNTLSCWKIQPSNNSNSQPQQPHNSFADETKTNPQEFGNPLPGEEESDMPF